MPDIQTELQKILQAWEQPETKTEEPMFNTTTNTSRATFEIVRDNPGLPKAEYIRKLETMGHKKASTSSLLAQMTRQGHIWVDSSGCLRPNQTEYRPLKCTTTIKNAAKKAAKTSKVITSKKYKTKEVPVPAGITALVEDHTERKTRDEVQHIMNTISLPDAKRLHKALNEYFGSV